MPDANCATRFGNGWPPTGIPGSIAQPGPIRSSRPDGPSPAGNQSAMAAVYRMPNPGSLQPNSLPWVRPAAATTAANLFACTLHDVGTEEQKRRLIPPSHPRREQVVPALQRARRGLGPRRPAHSGRARRRRVGDQRAEGVDVVRDDRRLRHAGGAHRLGCAEAPGHQLLHAADAPARRRGPADPPDHRRVGVQRGFIEDARCRPRTWSAS